MAEREANTLLASETSSAARYGNKGALTGATGNWPRARRSNVKAMVY